MKMQLRHILELPTIDNQSICGELIFLDKTLGSGDQVGQKGGILRVEVGKRHNRLLRNDQHMEGMGRFRMMECHQRFGLTQAFDGDGKTHVGKHPSNDNLYQPRLRQLPPRTSHNSLLFNP